MLGQSFSFGISARYGSSGFELRQGPEHGLRITLKLRCGFVLALRVVRRVCLMMMQSYSNLHPV